MIYGRNISDVKTVNAKSNLSRPHGSSRCNKIWQKGAGSAPRKCQNTIFQNFTCLIIGATNYEFVGVFQFSIVQAKIYSERFLIRVSVCPKMAPKYKLYVFNLWQEYSQALLLSWSWKRGSIKVYCTQGIDLYGFCCCAVSICTSCHAFRSVSSELRVLVVS